MDQLPNEIFQRWGHSFEEDAGDITVYRPAESDFPRARGRAGIELKPNGQFIDLRIGAGDAAQGIQGHWHQIGPNRIQVTFEGANEATRTLEVVQADADMLKVRQLPD